MQRKSSVPDARSDARTASPHCIGRRHCLERNTNGGVQGVFTCTCDKFLHAFTDQIKSFQERGLLVNAGIGVDDMFLLMSAWGETIHLQDLSVPDRVGITFSKAGIGITITSLTDFLAFLIGITSDFIVVRQFCIYTGML